MSPILRPISFLFLSAALISSFAWTAPKQERGHEKLRLQNTFSKPEDVVHYYCARDAEGFVWSGLLDAEREAFTFWKEAPSSDSFLIAKTFEIKPARIQRDEAEVDVVYEITGSGDAHGTRLPGPRSPYVIHFILKKSGASWKIAKPASDDIAPVVVESRFPMNLEIPRRSRP